MSYSVSINGTSYTLPDAGEVDWAGKLQLLFQALVAAGASAFTFGSKTTPANTSSLFLVPGGSDDVADASEYTVRVPCAGKVSKLYVQALAAPVTQGQVVTVRKNASDQTLTATLAAAATQAEDATHSFTVAAGDRLSVKVAGVAGIATGATGLRATILLTPS